MAWPGMGNEVDKFNGGALTCYDEFMITMVMLMMNKIMMINIMMMATIMTMTMLMMIMTLIMMRMMIIMMLIIMITIMTMMMECTPLTTKLDLRVAQVSEQKIEYITRPGEKKREQTSLECLSSQPGVL